MSLLKIYIPYLIATVLFLLPLPVRSQVPPSGRPQEFIRTHPFFFDAITYAGEDKAKSHIDFYLQVPHTEIRFVKEGEQFLGKYEVAISIQEVNKKDIQEISWVDVVRLSDFAATSSSKLFRLTQRGVDLAPGNYKIDVRFQDLESKKTSNIVRSLLVSDYSKDSLSLSDIMVVSRLTSDGTKFNIVPNISANVANHQDGFFLFFEIYTFASLERVNLSWKILNTKKEVVLSSSQDETLKGYKTQSFIRIGEFNPLPGEYRIIVEAIGVDEDKISYNATTLRSFAMRPADLPVSIDDLDKAIEQLIYIARPSEMDFLRENTDPVEKKKRFMDFWKKRDPDPVTARNELMEEYYDRVDYANRNFSHFLEGWKTDMGMVFIRFGKPDHVERHPFSQNMKPYEVWYYYQLNREFIFVDETGFGDYRLRYPTTDLWGRIR